MTEWLFPAKCPVCGGVLLPREALIHTECRERLDMIEEPVCMRCGRPLQEDTVEYCAECEDFLAEHRKFSTWDSGRCAFYYRGAVKEVLWALKNNGTREAVRLLGKQMAESQKQYLDALRPDCIVPVPLHSLKQRQRGFNQAELLAEAVAAERNIPVLSLLIKTKRTADQKSLAKEERKRNLRQVFAWNDETQMAELPKSVLIVDDVFTTGSTIAACAQVLKEHGVQKAGFLCACLGSGE